MNKKIQSPTVERAVEIAALAGNSVAEISEGWTKVKQVVFMKMPLIPEVRNRIAEELPSLKHWTMEGSPHNAPSEGYVCDADEVGLSFPRT